MEEVSVGLFGLGCVGQGFYDISNKSKNHKIKILKVCVKDLNKKRLYSEIEYTSNKVDIFSLLSLNVVVELTDDPDKAYLIVKEALMKKVPVVTANKKMLADHFEEFYQLQVENNTALLYEASVGGSVPILRNLEEYYDNDLLSKIKGILNGTCNYILTKMEYEKLNYKDALIDCQEKGFAETDPWLDVSGSDSKYKILIITAHAFGIILKPDDILNLGIQNVNFHDIKFAESKNCRIKMISYVEWINEKLRVYAIPHFIDCESQLFNINYEYNAVELETSDFCSQLISGKGAGKHPTGHAVFSDVTALKKGYAYSYKKLKTKTNNNFSRANIHDFLDIEFNIKLYIRFQDINQISCLEIIDIYDKGELDGNKWIIAEVKYCSLRELPHNNTIFLAVV